MEKLKNQIREEIAAIPIEMCQNAVENFKNRLDQFIAAGGHHVSDVILKTSLIKWYDVQNEQLFKIVLFVLRTLYKSAETVLYEKDEYYKHVVQ